MIAVIADTHMPKGARRLPERCVGLISAAEATIHAGDFFAASALEELRALPAQLELELGGHTLALIHDAGPAKGRLARLRRRFPDADAVVVGHSHLPLHEEEGGFQIFNPGSPTERRRALRASMGLLNYESGRLVFEHVWL